MMGYGNWGMMGGPGLFGVITWLLVIVDLALLAVFLWQRVSRK